MKKVKSRRCDSYFSLFSEASLIYRQPHNLFTSQSITSQYPVLSAIVLSILTYLGPTNSDTFDYFEWQNDITEKIFNVQAVRKLFLPMLSLHLPTKGNADLSTESVTEACDAPSLQLAAHPSRNLQLSHVLFSGEGGRSLLQAGARSRGHVLSGGRGQWALDSFCNSRSSDYLNFFLHHNCALARW